MKGMKAVLWDPLLILVMVICIPKIINTLWSILKFFSEFLRYSWFYILFTFVYFFPVFSSSIPVLETFETLLSTLFPINFWNFSDVIPPTLFLVPKLKVFFQEAGSLLEKKYKISPVAFVLDSSCWSCFSWPYFSRKTIFHFRCSILVPIPFYMPFLFNLTKEKN